MDSKNSRRNKCSYYKCLSSKDKYPNKHFHRFPRNENVSRQWVINSGNAKLLDISPQSLYKKKQICSDHFLPEDFCNASKPVKLRKLSVPVAYDENRPSCNSLRSPPHLEVLTPPICYTERSSTTIKKLERSPDTSTMSKYSSEILTMQTDAKSSHVSFTRKQLFKENVPERETIDFLNREIVLLREIVKEKTNEIRKLKRKLQRRKVTTNYKSKAKVKSKYSQTLVNMQIHHKSRSTWTDDEKEFALLTYFKSPSAYKFWRKIGINLPGVSTLKTWIGRFDCFPGIDLHFFEELKNKVSVMEENETFCTLILDEISIKKNIEYSNKYDFIEGFEDYGNFDGNGERFNRFGSQIMLFVIRGIYRNWKLPVAYFVCHTTMKNDRIKEKIQEVLKHLQAVGLRVRAVICDQGCNNQSAMKKLGVNVAEPNFIFNGSKIHVIFDPLHLIKNFRNNVLRNNFIFRNAEVDFNDIIKTYEIDQRSGTGRCLLKITAAHLNPDNFQKMNCGLALQIFSHSVAAAIRTCIDTGELTTETATNTANFVEFVNNLFDCLNSKKLYSSNPYASALSDEKPLIKQTMMDALNILKDMKKISRKGLTRPYCFDGMIITLKSIMNLFEEQKELGYKYLLTNRLNQDPIENMFSMFRQRGGFNANPTVKLFRSSFKVLIKGYFLKDGSNTNCEDDDDSLLRINSNMSHDVGKEPQHPIENVREEPSFSSSTSMSYKTSISKETHIRDRVTLQDCSNSYFAGYLAKKTIDKFKCDMCKNNLVEDVQLQNKAQLLILYKTYKSEYLHKGLMKPKATLTSITKKSLKIVKKILDTHPHKRNLASRMKKVMKKRLHNLLSEQFSTECTDHMEYLFDILIKCKIFKECKWRTEYAKSDKKKKRKMDLIQNL